MSISQNDLFSTFDCPLVHTQHLIDEPEEGVERGLDRVTTINRYIARRATRRLSLACQVEGLSDPFAAWIFPLKGAPLPAQVKPIPSVIDNQTAEGSVERNSIWADAVKRGSMPLQIRGAGTIVRGEGSATLVARVTVPASLTGEVHADQSATVNTRSGVVKGHVLRVNEALADETRTVDIALNGSLPAGVEEGLPVDATIAIGELDNVLWVGRPANIAANTSTSVFKIAADGTVADRVNVRFGRAACKRSKSSRD